MTVKEIRKAILAKENEIRQARNSVAKSKDVNEVRSLGETLDKLLDELNALNEQLIDAEDENDNSERSGEVPNDAELRNGNAMAFYGTGTKGADGMRSLYSTGGSVVSVNPLDGLALRSDETFASRLGTASKEKLDLGKYVRGAMTGDWTGAEAERRAMNTTTSGVVIPQVLSAQVLDTARNVSFFTGAGCPVVPLTNGNMTIARVKTDPTFKFYDELAEASESSMELEGVELKAKTARGFCYVSKELLMSAQNLHGVLVNAFAGAIAEMVDKAGLYGQYDSSTKTYDTFAPAGIMNSTAVGSITASNQFYSDYILAVGKVRRANGTPNTIGYNAAGEEAFNLIHDGNGQAVPIPKVLADMNMIVSNSFTEDSTKGSDAIVMDNQSVIVGIQNNILVRMTDQSDYCIKHGCVCFDVSIMLDIATVRPTHICKITGIKSTPYQAG